MSRFTLLLHVPLVAIGRARVVPSDAMAILFGIATVLSTLLGGWFALHRQDKLHLILGFSAGAVLGVAFFDLLPEALQQASPRFAASTVTLFVAVGVLLFMLLSRFMLVHPHGETCEEDRHVGRLGAGSLVLHSLLDGVAIGLAFQASAAVGMVVAFAVLAHDFSDGINTVSFVLKHNGEPVEARRWLLGDALAPLMGVLGAGAVHLPPSALGLVLASFCGLFLYIGASDLIPESHHRHPTLATSIMTVLGAAVIYLAVHLSGG
jgi:zinc transporter ZupT